jgi:hypothetical protein
LTGGRRQIRDTRAGYVIQQAAWSEDTLPTLQAINDRNSYSIASTLNATYVTCYFVKRLLSPAKPTRPKPRSSRLPGSGFSKKLENLKHAVALHFAHYNFCRVHHSLRVTPAMEAGITDHVWTLNELLLARQ